METRTIAEFDAKFRTEDLLVVRNAYWRWAVRPQQCTLGATVLSAARECYAWSNMTPEEFVGLKKMLGTVEAALKTCFSPDKLNYLMLMMIDSHVHFHVLPRYGGERRFHGAVWTDESWPGPPNLLQAAPVDGGLSEIRESLKAAATDNGRPS